MATKKFKITHMACILFLLENAHLVHFPSHKASEYSNKETDVYFLWWSLLLDTMKSGAHDL